MDIHTLPKDSKRPEDWLAWLADQRCLGAPIDTVVAHGMHYSVIGYAIGKWIAENKADELAERIAAEFTRLEAVLPR